MYDTIEERLEEYGREILRRMEALKCEKARGMEVPAVQKREKAKSIQRRKQEPARRALFGMTGIDGTAIDGVGVETMEAVIRGRKLECVNGHRIAETRGTDGNRRETDRPTARRL